MEQYPYNSYDVESALQRDEFDVHTPPGVYEVAIKHLREEIVGYDPQQASQALRQLSAWETAHPEDPPKSWRLLMELRRGVIGQVFDTEPELAATMAAQAQSALEEQAQHYQGAGASQLEAGELVDIFCRALHVRQLDVLSWSNLRHAKPEQYEVFGPLLEGPFSAGIRLRLVQAEARKVASEENIARTARLRSSEYAIMRELGLSVQLSQDIPVAIQARTSKMNADGVLPVIEGGGVDLAIWSSTMERMVTNVANLGAERCELLRKKFGIVNFDKYLPSQLETTVDVAEGTDEYLLENLHGGADLLVSDAFGDHNGAMAGHPTELKTKLVAELHNPSDFYRIMIALNKHRIRPHTVWVSAHGSPGMFGVGTGGNKFWYTASPTAGEVSGQDNAYNLDQAAGLQRLIAEYMAPNNISGIRAIGFISCNQATEDPEYKASLAETVARNADPETLLVMAAIGKINIREHAGKLHYFTPKNGVTVPAVQFVMTKYGLATDKYCGSLLDVQKTPYDRVG